jgi:hypothetical protein
MLFILDHPARAGTEVLCYDLKRRHGGRLSCFIVFCFFITVGSRPVFFYLLWAEHPSHTLPFHYGPSLFRSLFGSLVCACPDRVLKQGLARCQCHMAVH